MPSERLYTIRGKSPAALTHEIIQLSSYDPRMQYQIVEFKVMPAETATVTDCYGTISMGANSNIDPTKPNFANQNEIAWSHQAYWQNGTALPGSESIVVSDFSLTDEKLFAYDIHLHTKDAMDNSEINWFILIKKYYVSADTGSIASLRQFQYNDQENA